MNLSHNKRIISHEVSNRVSPSTGITFSQVYYSRMLTGKKNIPRGYDIDMDTLITLLDHGYGDSEGFDSTEFVL